MLKVIIVDDEHNIKEGLKAIIEWEQYGFTVAGLAGDGIEALKLYEAENPDLVVTDIKMPGMDGIELSRELKKRNPGAEIIIISGYNDFSFAKEAIKNGVNNYLLKPVNVEELCNELSEVRQRINVRLMREKEQHEEYLKLKNYYLEKLVRGELLKPDIMKIAPEFGIPVGNASCCMLIAEISHYDNLSRHTGEDELESVLHSVESTIYEVLVENKQGLLFENTDGQYGIILAREDGVISADGIKDIISEIKKHIREQVGLKITLAVGEIVNSIFGIHTSYKSALTALEVIVAKEIIIPGPRDDGFKNILSYVQKHYNEDINLKKLSKMYFINPVYLGQIFKKEAGYYFNDYINRLRVENAKRLIEENVLSIKEISEKVGYKYLEHFYKNFKNITGYLPGEYRDLIKI